MFSWQAPQFQKGQIDVDWSTAPGDRCTYRLTGRVYTEYYWLDFFKALSSVRTSVKLIWQNLQKSSQQLITRTLHVHYTYITRTLYVTKTHHAANSIRCTPVYISCKLSKLTKNIEQHSRVVIRQTQWRSQAILKWKQGVCWRGFREVIAQSSTRWGTSHH